MKNYVISLTTAKQRREHITHQFGKQHIDFEFFDAVSIESLDTYIDICPSLRQSTKLAEVEKACFLSHLTLWKKCIDENLKYIAIFEDDVYLGENASLFFDDSQWLYQKNIDFLKTETCLQQKKLSKNAIPLTNDRFAYQLLEYHLGTGGYILSHRGAKSLLGYVQSLPKEQLIAIDNLIFGDFLSKSDLPVYQLQPAIVIQQCILHPNQNHLPSVIEQSRKERKKTKPKRALSAKIKGELSNAYRKTFGKFSRQKICFK